MPNEVVIVLVAAHGFGKIQRCHRVGCYLVLDQSRETDFMFSLKKHEETRGASGQLSMT